MAVPTYERQYSFANFQSLHPSDPIPGDELDAELNAVKATTDELGASLAQIQRDDGQLANASVGLDQLKPEVAVGVAPAVPWAASTAYALNAMVFYGLVLYRCITAHTSDVAFDSSKFLALADLSSLSYPPNSIGASQLQSSAVTTAKIADGAVTVAKIGSLPGSALLGRYSSVTGAVQFVTLGSGLSFVGNQLVASLSVADGSISTAKLAGGAVTSPKLAAGVAVANLGFTPLNKAGDTITGALTKNSHGVHLWHDGAGYASGSITFSTLDPSGGADGDIWFKYS